MKPIETLLNLVDRLIVNLKGTNARNPKPGDLIKGMSAEKREELSQLKSDDIAHVRVDESWMMSAEYENKLKALEFEKKMGIQPPSRKKYE